MIEEMVKELLEKNDSFEKNVGSNTKIITAKLNNFAVRKSVFLHESCIAKFYNDNQKFHLKISDGGVKSSTTKRRLNQILNWYSEYMEKVIGGLYYEDHQIIQRKGIWYISCFDEKFPFDLMKDENDWISVNYHVFNSIINDIFDDQES